MTRRFETEPTAYGEQVLVTGPMRPKRRRRVGALVHAAHFLIRHMTDQQTGPLRTKCAPITAADRLRILAHAPLTPKHQQKPLDIGLFDELGRSQLDFFDCSTGRRDPAPSAGAIPHPNNDEENTK